MNWFRRTWYWIIRRKPDRRMIFHFRTWDGEHSADPMEIERGLIHYLGDDWSKKLSSLNDKPPFGIIGTELGKFWAEREATRQKILATVDMLFRTKPFRDNEGDTEIERLAILEGYRLFCLHLVEAARPFGNVPSRDVPPPPSNPT